MNYGCIGKGFGATLMARMEKEGRLWGFGSAVLLRTSIPLFIFIRAILFIRGWLISEVVALFEVLDQGGPGRFPVEERAGLGARAREVSLDDRS